MSDDRRSIEREVVVPGSLEEVWRAIATGPGISSWSVPHTEVEWLVEAGADGTCASRRRQCHVVRTECWEREGLGLAVVELDELPANLAVLDDELRRSRPHR